VLQAGGVGKQEALLGVEGSTKETIVRAFYWLDYYDR
jgi:hypothetical protein